MLTAQDMDVGAAHGALEHTRDEYFFAGQGRGADRAVPFQVSVYALHAAAYVHEAVSAAGD